MVKRSKVFVMALGLALAGLAAVPSAKAGMGADCGDCKMMMQKKVDKLAKKLKLSDAQKEQVSKLVEEKHAKMEAVSKEMMDIGEDFHAKVSAVLQGEQKEKFEKMHGRHMKKMKGCCMKK